MNHNTKFHHLNHDYAITARIKFVRKLIPGVASYVKDMWLARLPHATSRLTRAKTAPVGRLVRAGHRVTSAVSPLASVAAAVA